MERRGSGEGSQEGPQGHELKDVSRLATEETLFDRIVWRNTGGWVEIRTPQDACQLDADSLRHPAGLSDHDIGPQAGEVLLEKHNRTGRRFRGVEEE